jgi:L-rhamnose isomerase / sugar isomerase
MLLPYLTTQAYNDAHLVAHQREFRFLSESFQEKGVEVEQLLKKLDGFQVAIPSWALGTGGTRFGRFPAGGEPRNLEEKMHDVALLDRMSRCCSSISLHIPWDIPSDGRAIRSLANDLGLRFDAVNSNTFQDQPEQPLSYRYGSLSHADKAVRRQAIDHNLEVVQYGAELGTDVLSLWLSDGSNFPGQNNLSGALERTQESLAAIYEAMPGNFKMFIEYKPFEPNFYATVIPDWGTAYLLAERTGDRASVLVDLGHHLPNTNIEQIVATVLLTGKLGGFHFNDSKYADDDLTTGSIRPYQLFLIFHELVSGLNAKNLPLSSIGWMIDASHNIKDPLEDLLQALEAIQLALAQALIVDAAALHAAQLSNDPVGAEEILHEAFRRDLRPLLAEYRLRKGGALCPIQFFREHGLRNELVKQRGKKTLATGL